MKETEDGRPMTEADVFKGTQSSQGFKGSFTEPVCRQRQASSRKKIVSPKLRQELIHLSGGKSVNPP
jgi:hypothetical protein